MRSYDPSILKKPISNFSTSGPPATRSDEIPKSSVLTTTRITSTTGMMTPRELSSKLSSSKPTPARAPPRMNIIQPDHPSEHSSRPVATPATTAPSVAHNHLHSSAAAPRQSEAFKRLGQASLVSSSIFKSTPSTPSQPRHINTNHKPSTTTPNSTPLHSSGSRAPFNPQRAPGSQSQMAAALQGLGITPQVSTSSNIHRPPPTHSRPFPTSAPSTVAQPTRKVGTKRKSDENLPVPARPPPNLPPSVPPLQVMEHTVLNKKARPPPRQSLAFNALTRNALVSSSPFKASSSTTSAAKIASNSAQNLDILPSHPPSSTPFGPPSEGDAPSSNDSDMTLGTPPPAMNNHPLPPRPSSPRSGGTTNGVLKSQRLGGPRSFTPPHSPRSPSFVNESKSHGIICRAPSALSTMGRRRERRKTVTWGGEDVLEFEWEEECRRTSVTSSMDSGSPTSDLKATNSSSDSSSDFDISDRPHSPTTVLNDECNSYEDPYWRHRSDHTDRHRLPHQDQDELDQSSPPDQDGPLDRSHDSLIIHDDSEDLIAPGILENGLSLAEDSFSAETDPVDQMVDALLTSPDLAGHINSSSTQPWPKMHSASDYDPTPSTLSDTGIDKQSEVRDDLTKSSGKLPKDDPSSNGTRRLSRFPYLQPEPPLLPPKSIEPATIIETRPTPEADISENDSIDRGASFQPISLTGLGLEDSLFSEASMISSILESSTLNVKSLETISSAGSQPMLSSTPRASYTDQLPAPNPSSPAQYLPSSASPTEVEETSSGTIIHSSPRRPLPRPPPTSSSPQSSQSYLPSSSTSIPTQLLSQANHNSPFPSYDLPSSSSTGWVRPVVESTTSESDTGCESNLSSPGGTRPRITRKKIHDRMRDRDRAVKSGDDSIELTHCLLPREPTSLSASIHKLGANGEEEKLELNLDVTMNSAELSRSTVTLGPLKEIQARPPMRAQQVTLTDSIMEDACRIQETITERQQMTQISSGLDKLARGLHDLVDGTKPCDSLTSIDRLDSVNVTEATCLPSKTIMVKGVGRRRRSLSTGGADLDETGTGAGAKAVVKSTPVKRYSLAVDKETSKITSGLLFNTIQPGMSKADLQEPLNRVLQKANDSRSYHVSESDEIVVASDHTITAGVAGDVAANRNWRKLRKVSDINQHAAQLKAFWAENDHVNKIGRVFVKMSKLVFRSLPPLQPPAHFQVVIDNGVHEVKTPFYKLEPEVTIGVEFELVRAKKLEFSLAFSIPLDEPLNAHLKPQPPPRPISPPRPLPQSVPPSTSSPKRLFGFLAPNSKRSSKNQQQALQQKQQQINEMEREKASLARQLASSRQAVHPLVCLLNRKHVLATALVNFEQYAQECLGKWKHAVVPCMSALEDPVKAEMQMRQTFTGPIGQVSLEFLSLPPIPKLPNATIPNSGSECLKGLKIAEWWQEVWHEGVLSQLGADCPTWRRRTFKVTGGSLFAYNDIMKKISAEIRLTEVVSLEDCGNVTGDENVAPKQSFINDQGEVLPPFTFRLLFKDGSEILFHADTQSDFKRWKSVLRQLMGKIQPLPAWAELLRLQIAARRAIFAESSKQEDETLRAASGTTNTPNVGNHHGQEPLRPVGYRLPGRRPRSPKSRNMGTQLSTHSSSQEEEESTMSRSSSSSEIVSNYQPTSTLTNSGGPGSTMAMMKPNEHRHMIQGAVKCSSKIPSYTNTTTRRPTSSLLTSDSTIITSSHRPTLSTMSNSTNGSATTTTAASSVLSRPTYSSSSSTTSNTTTTTNPPYSKPLISQLKRSKGPVKL